MLEVITTQEAAVAQYTRCIRERVAEEVVQMRVYRSTIRQPTLYACRGGYRDEEVVVNHLANHLDRTIAKRARASPIVLEAQYDHFRTESIF